MWYFFGFSIVPFIVTTGKFIMDDDRWAPVALPGADDGAQRQILAILLLLHRIRNILR